MKIDVCEFWGEIVVFCGKFDLGVGLEKKQT